LSQKNRRGTGFQTDQLEAEGDRKELNRKQIWDRSKKSQKASIGPKRGPTHQRTKTVSNRPMTEKDKGRRDSKKLRNLNGKPLLKYISKNQKQRRTVRGLMG